MRAAVASCELSLQKNAMPIFQLLRPEIYNKRLIWNSSSPSSLRIARGSCYSAFRLREDQSMPSHKSFSLIFAVLLCASIFSLASDKKSKEITPAETSKPSYELPQPATETLDLTMYQRIREEGISHSHIMEYASGLMDGIGPRLTGSPNLKRANEWTRDQLTAMGCSNAHLEGWGEFGMGWRQLNTWVRMTAPDTAVFIAQAGPWSPATKGPVNASAVWVDIKN